MVTPASTVYLVSCVSKKRTQACAAKDLYLSEWFKRARRYVEATGSAWYILSAGMGLVHPDAMLDYYDTTLNAMGAEERRAWAHRVQRQMDEQLPAAGLYVVLAGQRYREHLIPYLRGRGRVEAPLARLGIGEQLQWLGSFGPLEAGRTQGLQA